MEVELADIVLSWYFLVLFWTRYTLVEAVVPNPVPVIVRVDFRMGEEEVLERAVMVGARAGL